MKITLQQLKDKSACAKQVALFEKTFGAEVNVTVTRAVAVADKFNWEWASKNLLSAPAQEAYDSATAAAWEAYCSAIAAARKVYNSATAAARKVYNSATAPAQAAYDSARAPAQAVSSKAVAKAFALAYNSAENRERVR